MSSTKKQALPTKKQALILVGGYGTRLRPLTYTIPKPLVPFINRPILEHQIEALVDVGVTEIVLAIGYYSDLIVKQVDMYKEKYNISIIYSKEDKSLGTAGPLALARKHLHNLFYVLNSDVICQYPLKELMEYHISHGREATMLTTTVTDPLKYGLVETYENQSVVKQFIEKPKETKLNRINAGIYVFNESILDRIELRECSLEREIFPKLVEEKCLMVYELKGFWMDIGQVKDYIAGQKLYLENLAGHDKDCNKNMLVKIYGEQHFTKDLSLMNDFGVVFGHNVYIGEGATIGKNVVIGNNVRIGKNVCICDATIFDNVIVEDNVVINDSIVGWNSIIRRGATVLDESVLGDSSVLDENTNLISTLFVSQNEAIVNKF